MNHVYRIVFNRGLGLWQVVGEHARKQGKQAGRTGGVGAAYHVERAERSRRWHSFPFSFPESRRPPSRKRLSSKAVAISPPHYRLAR